MPDEQIQPRELTSEEKDRAAAEAEKHRAEARKFAAEALDAEQKAAVGALELARAQQKYDREVSADGYGDRSYQFQTGVDGGSAHKCIAQLAAWHREDPVCEMEIIFDSPGGSVVDGLHLFDYILDLRDMGHKITTRTRGMAASMAGILLQAGDVRVMGPQASLMLHEASFGASGKIGDVEDTVEWVNKVQDRILSIFADRCQSSGDQAIKKLTKRQLRTRWRRKNWWLDAIEALEFGLVDEIR